MNKLCNIVWGDSAMSGFIIKFACKIYIQI